MRRLGFALLFAALATGPVQAMQAKKPAKKSVAPKPAARKAAHPSASTAAKTKPSSSARASRSAVEDAGNRAAEAAAAERVHAWMRDHHEVIADDAPAAKPLRRPVGAPSTAAAASTPAKTAPVKDDAQKATTEDFLKAAEQRKALEDKQPAADAPDTAEDAKPAPKSEAAPPKPVAGKTAVAEEKLSVTPQENAPAKAKLTLARPEPPKPSTQRVELAKPVATAATASKPAIEEKAASELPAPPVLAVKRTELVEEDEIIGSSSKLPQPKLTFRRGRLVVPAPLLGSRAILVRQNVVADRYGLERVQDDGDLERMRKSRDLVALPDNKMMQVDDRLAVNRRYARPWAIKFLNDLGRAHFDRFHGALQVNSAVRTVEFQQRLIRTNGNAAPAEGDTASPHLTGQAIDIAKHGLSMTEIAWLRAYLLPLVQEGKIDVEEEFQQACFHISIYKNYMPEPKTKAKPKSRVPKALATAVP